MTLLTDIRALGLKETTAKLAGRLTVSLDLDWVCAAEASKSALNEAFLLCHQSISCAARRPNENAIQILQLKLTKQTTCNCTCLCSP